MRVKPEELARIRNKVVRRGERLGGVNLEGAVIDGDYAIVEAGFTDPKIKKTGELKRMVVYGCRPEWSPFDKDEVGRRLEEAWMENGAFSHEAHSLTVERDIVALDFVTWWDDDEFYTGRIEIALAGEG